MPLDYAKGHEFIILLVFINFIIYFSGCTNFIAIYAYFSCILMFVEKKSKH